MGWQTTWERRICHVDCYLARFNESETGRRTDGRFLEIYTIRGRKIKVVGWAWEYFWEVGGLFLYKKCVSPANINLNFGKSYFYIKIHYFPVFLYYSPHSYPRIGGAIHIKIQTHVEQKHNEIARGGPGSPRGFQGPPGRRRQSKSTDFP